MSFRRDGDKSNKWRKRLDARPDSMLKARLPEFLFRDEKAWRHFLDHGIHEGNEHGPKLDIVAMMTDDERRALFELISEVYSESERASMFIWKDLQRMLDS